MYHSIELTTHYLQLPRLAPEFNGYRIVQVSDFHIGEWHNEKRLKAAVEIANRQSPHLIALTGDFVSDDPPAYTCHLQEELCRLRAADGVAAVLGNHDHHHDPEAIRSILVACHIHDLSNRLLSVKRGAASLHIAGVDSYCKKQANLPHVLKHLPGDGAAILLAHEPDFAEISAASGRFDLQLSGHSHGGQVRFPFIGSVFYPRHAHKYPLGRYQIDGMIQYTNRGIGLGHLPIRLNCPPEVSLFILAAPAR